MRKTWYIGVVSVTVTVQFTYAWSDIYRPEVEEAGELVELGNVNELWKISLLTPD